jgi:signal peptidase I
MRSSVETLPLPRAPAATRARELPAWLPLAKRATLILAQLALLGALLWFGLPQSLGGRAGWVVISGTSMLPRMHTGDLALVERQSSYHVGEVVAYRVPKGEVGAGYEVIHRIVGGNAKTGWIVKGDNRTGPDVWHPTNSDIVGARLLWVPKAYLVLRFLHTPLLLGLLAAFGIFFTILLGGKGDAEPEVVEEES